MEGRWNRCVVLTVATVGCSFEPGVAVIGGLDNAYDVACDCAPPPVTRTLAVADDADDAEQDVAASTVDLTSPDLELAEDLGAAQLVGIRFAILGIPPGAAVLSARIQFTADESSAGATTLVIRAQAADDAPTFTDADDDIGGRPLGAASVPWAPGPWTAGDAGADQLTPELAPLLQELVNRPGWTQASAAVFVVSGTGERVATSRDGDPALAPRLIVQYQEGGVMFDVSVCVPEILNPNLETGHVPDAAELAADVAGRVQPTVQGLASACGYPSVCTCGLVPASEKFSEACDQPCVADVLDDCNTEFDPVEGKTTATNVAGDTPVCTAHSPLAAALYGQRSRCEVSGTATIEVDGEDTKTPDASGVISFVGSPCPGQSCEVGMEYALEIEPVTYSSFFGSATFRDMSSVGATAAGGDAVVDGAGNGTFAPGAIDVAARGQRDDDPHQKLVGSNENPVAVGVDWDDAVCELVGALSGNVDPELRRCEPAGPDANATCTTSDDCADDPACTDEVCDCLVVPETEQAMSLDVSGVLVNQPPSADAGPDRVVECDLAGAASFELTSLSADPDGDIALTRWYRGNRTGPEVGFAPRVNVVQPVASTTDYVVRVIDSFGQADEDTTRVTVEDTTPPVLSCNAPTTIRPGTHGLAFTATAEDVCDPAATPVVTSPRCEKNGRPHPCRLSASGDTLTVINPSGVGTRILWDLTVTDAFGNVSAAPCEMVVSTR